MMAGGEADQCNVVVNLRMNGKSPAIPYMTSWLAQSFILNLNFSIIEETVVLACDSKRRTM
jgi:hypothetical protein